MNKIVETLQAIGMFVLVTTGVIGMVWRTVKEDGWFSTVFMKLIDALFDNPLVMFPLLIGGGLLGKLWHDHQVEKGHMSKLPNVFLYLVMAAGAYFVWHFLAYGSL